MQSQEYPDLQFVEPAAWGSGRDGYSVQYIVVHYTAGSEGPTAALDGAAYDQRRTDGTSTHYFVDRSRVVQCVYTWNRANACYRYGNRMGIQYELCGTQQTRAQWLDAASDATLWNAARQMARDCKKYGIPVRKITPSQMLAGWKGIVGHADVTLAYGLGDHMDPGAEFPYDVLLERIQSFLAPQPESTPATTDEDDEDMTKGVVLYHAAGTYNGSAVAAEYVLCVPGEPPIRTPSEGVATVWVIQHHGPTGAAVNYGADVAAYERQVGLFAAAVA